MLLLFLRRAIERARLSAARRFGVVVVLLAEASACERHGGTTMCMISARPSRRRTRLPLDEAYRWSACAVVFVCVCWFGGRVSFSTALLRGWTGATREGAGAPWARRRGQLRFQPKCCGRLCRSSRACGRCRAQVALVVPIALNGLRLVRLSANRHELVAATSWSCVASRRAT